MLQVLYETKLAARWSTPAERIRAASALLKYLDRPKTAQKSPQIPPVPMPSTT
jgi:hypothetical protein